MALKMPFHPKGLKPPPAVKLPGWNDAMNSATIVMAGMAIFHHTATLLVSDSHFTPMTLMNEKRSIRRAATTYPLGVTMIWLLTVWVRFGRTLCAYWSAASTSIGAVVTAPRNANQPLANPIKLPNA